MGLDADGYFSSLPEGVTPGSDTAALITGVLLGVAGQAVQVTVAGSDGVWVPAVPAIYTVNGPVRLLRSPLDGGKLTYCLGPLTDAPTVVVGTVTAVNPTDGTLTVTALSGTYMIPYVAGTYSVGAKVHVLRSPSRYGAPEIVLGPLGNYTGVDPSAPGSGNGNPAQGVSRETVIVPQWSGSWKTAQSRWNSWNTDRYGGPSTLWQGDGYGSGPMTGLATYGDQIVNLGASSIISMKATVWRADSSSSDGRVAVLQPSPHGSQPGGAPTTSGDTAASTPITPGRSTQVTLPDSVLGGFRTGALRGIALVGGDYAGFSGTPGNVDPRHADGMALTIQYRVLA